jgi:hypothetical protein
LNSVYPQLESDWFQTLIFEQQSWFQNLPFKFNLRRYTMVAGLKRQLLELLSAAGEEVLNKPFYF